MEAQVDGIRSLPKIRAARFLRLLQKYPFVALVFVGDELQILVKNTMTDEHWLQLSEVLDEIVA